MKGATNYERNIKEDWQEMKPVANLLAKDGPMRVAIDEFKKRIGKESGRMRY